jgi:hypothetical protein
MPQDGSRDETVFASAEDPDWLPPEINTGVAHSARVYDWSTRAWFPCGRGGPTAARRPLRRPD